MRSCFSCKWFKQYVDGEDLGECRKYAPAPGMIEGAVAFWPVVDVDDGCGEHEDANNSEG